MSVADRLDTNLGRSGPGMLRRALETLAGWLRAPVSSARIRPGYPRPAWARPGRLVLGGAIAFLAIALTMLFLDSPAVMLQRKLTQPVFDAFQIITEWGRSGWLLTPVGVAIIALALVTQDAIGRINRLVIEAVVARLGFVFLAVAVPGATVGLAKHVIGRTRPLHWEKGGAFAYQPFGWDVDHASLPSGHGTTAFATAFALGVLFPRTRVFFWTLAVGVALSRVVLSAHYPSDVLAGAVVGVLGAVAVRNWFATRRLGFAVGPDRVVRPLPGPSWRRLARVARAVLSRRR